MFVFLNRYKTIIVFVFLCIVSLALSWLTVGKSYSNAIKHSLSIFLIPVDFCSSVISSISGRFSHVGAAFASMFREPVEEAKLQSLESDLESLKRQLDEERARNSRLEELYEVCTNLTQSNPSFSLIPAKVIAVEPTDWFRYLTIDKGRSDGVATDMAVITRSSFAVDTSHPTGAIVGRITDAQKNSSRVQLITDRLSVVAVTIGPLADLVLLNGRPETEDCVIDEVPSTTHDMLKDGNVVKVDERSSIFPPGMLVGKISSIEKGIHFCRIRVQPAFRFASLREVMVVAILEE
jgi:rod shape-determining protein MreC